MKSCLVVWCIVIASVSGSVVKRDTKNFALPTCPEEQAVCSVIKETGSDGDSVLVHRNTCACPGKSVCPTEPESGDQSQTIAVDEGVWYGICSPVAKCTEGEDALEVIEDEDQELGVYTKVNCVCPPVSEDDFGQVLDEQEPDESGHARFKCAGAVDKRGRLSSFYKRSVGRNNGISSFYKRGRYSDNDKPGRFYFYKRDSADDSADDESNDDDSSMDKRGRYGAKERHGNFYFYKRGHGISSFYKRAPQGGISSFYKRGRWGDDPSLSSFYKRGYGGDNLSSFYKRGGNFGGMSSFYKRNGNGNDDEMDKRGRYGSGSDQGRFYFYKRGRYGQSNDKGRFYFYKRGGRYGTGSDKQRFYFY